MANFIYDKAKLEIMKGVIDMDSHTFKCALVDDTYTPDQANDESWNAAVDPAAKELANGNGYTTNGATLGSVAVSPVAGNTVKFDAADVSWTSATFTARYGIIYDDSTSPKYLVACIDFGANKSVTNGTFTIQWNTSGIITLT